MTREHITINSPKPDPFEAIARGFDKLAALQEAEDRRLAEMFEQMEESAKRYRIEHAANVARPIAEVLRNTPVKP